MRLPSALKPSNASLTQRLPLSPEGTKITSETEFPALRVMVSEARLGQRLT